MAQLMKIPLTDAHLLCLMEVWFDESVPLVQALAQFNYALLPNETIGCPFCGEVQSADSAYQVLGGFRHFEHACSCPVLQAQTLLADMIDESQAP